MIPPLFTLITFLILRLRILDLLKNLHKLRTLGMGIYMLIEEWENKLQILFIKDRQNIILQR